MRMVREHGDSMGRGELHFRHLEQSEPFVADYQGADQTRRHGKRQVSFEGVSPIFAAELTYSKYSPESD